MSVFKAYDIRGVWGKDFNEETCYKVGFFLPKLLGTKCVVVGRDVRVSSPTIFENLTKGITDSGADVWSLGLATTPMVYFATVFLKADASVQITASHNPPEYNGLKISKKGALPVGGETGLKELENLVLNGTVEKVKKPGIIKDYSYVKDEYISFLKQFAKGLDSLNISIDPSNGMANLVIKDILPNAHYIFDSFDGSFPNHEPNPLVEENCRALEKFTLENESDCGIMYDGDADRVVFVDNKGRWIQPDYVSAIIGSYYAKKGRVGNCLVDIRTSKSTTDYLEKMGWKVTIWKVGHAFAKLKIREIDGIFGGELAGHYYFKDFFNCDSGVFASLLVLSVVKDLKEQGKTLSDLVDEIIKYENSSEINFKLEDKDGAIKDLYEKYAVSDRPSAIYDFDGYRIEFPTWWFNVRKSNTEPYLRIVLEAKTPTLLNEKIEEISKIIRSHK